MGLASLGGLRSRIAPQTNYGETVPRSLLQRADD